MENRKIGQQSELAHTAKPLHRSRSIIRWTVYFKQIFSTRPVIKTESQN